MSIPGLRSCESTSQIERAVLTSSNLMRGYLLKNRLASGGSRFSLLLVLLDSRLNAYAFWIVDEFLFVGLCWRCRHDGHSRSIEQISLFGRSISELGIPFARNATKALAVKVSNLIDQGPVGFKRDLQPDPKRSRKFFQSTDIPCRIIYTLDSGNSRLGSFQPFR